MLELAPEHPVSKSMNILYWPGGDPIEGQMLSLANVVCAWGSAEAVQSIKSQVGSGVDVLEFGPKTSFAIIGQESASSKKVALDLAHDVALYDQEACFSPQIAFVEGDYQLFVENLAKGLEIYKTLMPKAQTIPDSHAQVWRTRMEAFYNNNTVIKTDDTEWTIAVIKEPSEINEHPLSRFIFIIPVENILDCLPYITPDVQTLTISPWHRNSEIRDEATLRGASKITEVGLIEAMRIGSTHDDIYPLQRMVRWVCVERGCDYWGKYIEQGPVDTTLWLMKNEQQLERVPLD
jgi:long-chain-fatty-acyl-CoA reductase